MTTADTSVSRYKYGVFLKDPEGFNKYEGQLRQHIFKYLYEKTPNNHNRIVATLNKMIDSASAKQDERATIEAFDTITLDLYIIGFHHVAKFKFNDFRKYLDENWIPYE